MIVCICRKISEHDIASAVHAGCDSFEQLQDELCVARACGACHDCAHETFHALATVKMPASCSSGTLAAGRLAAAGGRFVNATLAA